MKSIKNIFLFLTIIWLTSFAFLFFPTMPLDALAIRPRAVSGLLGIPFSFLLHGSLPHLFSNSISLLILLLLLSFSEPLRKTKLIVVMCTLSSGFLTWLLGSGGLVVGASGLAFALMGYLIFDALTHPCMKSIATGIVTLFLFGGSIFSLYHFAPHISLAAHAGGLISGAIIAKVIGGK